MRPAVTHGGGYVGGRPMEREAMFWFSVYNPAVPPFRRHRSAARPSRSAATGRPAHRYTPGVLPSVCVLFLTSPDIATTGLSFVIFPARPDWAARPTSPHDSRPSNGPSPTNRSATVPTFLETDPTVWLCPARRGSFVSKDCRSRSPPTRRRVAGGERPPADGCSPKGRQPRSSVTGNPAGATTFQGALGNQGKYLRLARS